MAGATAVGKKETEALSETPASLPLVLVPLLPSAVLRRPQLLKFSRLFPPATAACV